MTSLLTSLTTFPLHLLPLLTSSDITTFPSSPSSPQPPLTLPLITSLLTPFLILIDFTLSLITSPPSSPHLDTFCLGRHMHATSNTHARHMRGGINTIKFDNCCCCEEINGQHLLFPHPPQIIHLHHQVTSTLVPSSDATPALSFDPTYAPFIDPSLLPSADQTPALSDRRRIAKRGEQSGVY